MRMRLRIRVQDFQSLRDQARLNHSGETKNRNHFGTDWTMPTPPRRRWFQFGLVSIFVLIALIAVPLGLLTRELSIVRQRNAYRAISEAERSRRIQESQLGGVFYETDTLSRERRPRRSISVWRKILGDEAVGELYVRTADSKDVEKLFPEIDLIILIEPLNVRSGP